MKELPILFSGPMSRAILEGRKTQTRRVVKPQPEALNKDTVLWSCKGIGGKMATNMAPPTVVRHSPYKPGDVLWVRETWRPRVTDSEHFIQYKSDGACEAVEFDALKNDDQEHQWHGIFYDYSEIEEDKHWHPSIHMPEWACRTRLEVVSVRVERLQDISEEDAIKEGVEKIHVEHAPSPSNDFSGDFSDAFKDYLNPGEFAGWNGDAGFCCTAKESFMTLWASLYGQESLDANPYVWVIEYRRLG